MTALQFWRIKDQDFQEFWNVKGSDFVTVSIEIQKSDVIIVNQGLHHRELSGAQMNFFFDTLGNFLHHETRNSSIQVIIRSTTS